MVQQVQSFGCFATKGLHLETIGNCNDYFGKGLSGARLVARVPEGVSYKAEENIIHQNVALYGATAGEAYINGIAGERFCVRNSAPLQSLKSIGDHGCGIHDRRYCCHHWRFWSQFCCWYGGGIAYLYAADGTFDERNFNMEMIGLENPLYRKI